MEPSTNPARHIRTFFARRSIFGIRPPSTTADVVIVTTLFSSTLGRLFVLLALLATGCAPRPASQALVSGAEITEARLADGPIALTSGWSARPGIEGALGVAGTPGAWTPVDIRDTFVQQGFPDQGSVSYRLPVRLHTVGPPLYAALQHTNNAHRLWVVFPSGEAQMLAQSGTVSDRADDVVLSRKPVVFAFPDAQSFTLVWQISNVGYPRGGPFHAIHVGTRQQIERVVLWRVATTIALTGFFLALGVVALLAWLQNAAEPAVLALALLAFLAATRTLAQSGLLEYLAALPFDTRVVLEIFTALALPGATAFLLWTAMPWAFAPWHALWRTPPADALHRAPHPRNPRARVLPLALRRLNTCAAAIGLATSVASTAAVIFAPTTVVGALLLPSSLVFLMLLGLMLLLSGEVLYVRYPLAPLFALSFAGLALVGLHDFLVTTSLLPYRVYLLSHGYAVFFVVFCTAYVTVRLRDARRAEEANTDLTRQVEQRSLEVQEASKAAQVAYLARSQFVAAVSHELRTPLASMMGYAHLLDDEVGPQLPPHHREFLHSIQASGDRLLHLINDLLDLSRIEAGRFDLHPTAVAASAAAREVGTHLYPLAREKNLTLDVQADLDDGAMLIADPMRLRQVLLNLVANAIKFTERGAVRLRVAGGRLGDRDAVVFSVEDTGVGISPEFLPYLFDRFSQEARTYAQTQSGTGLGLYLTRELVERMNGTIGVESTPGEGSVFTVTLPSAPVAAMPLPPNRRARPLVPR